MKTVCARQGFDQCITHGARKKRKPCSVAGCTATSNRKGLCGTHGGGAEECWIAGCSNQICGLLKTKYGANCYSYKHTKKEENL